MSTGFMRRIGIRRPRKFSSPRRNFRRDIQGLRAFAVTVVILDHLLAWPSGGFVGVDIFFVLSGFLITGHLMREWERTGRILFIEFYKARIKRIMPAAVLVVAVTLLLSTYLLNKSRASSVAWDAAWSLLFVGNWRFAASGTDYFQAEGPRSPLQHFWSLAVEEQFYFVWPWVMLLALALVSRLRYNALRPRVVVVIVLGFMSIVSFCWSLYETSATPTVAYFSTFSRAWELGLGALLALAAPLFLRINDDLRPVIAWVGIFGMIVSVFIIDSSQAFPAPVALLPVIATGLVLVAGTGGKQRYLLPLTNPISGFVGNMSYSLYLWHFPVIVFTKLFLPEGGVFYYASVLIVTVLVSFFAYYLVEDAIRKSSWLTAKSGRRKKSKRVFTRAYINVAMSFLAVATVCAVAVAVIPRNSPEVSGSSFAVDGAVDLSGDNLSSNDAEGPEITQIRGSLRDALLSTSWPNTDPALNDAIGGDQAAPEVAFCGMPGKFEIDGCTIGSPSGTKTAVLLGNSAAMTFAQPLSKALGDEWQLIVHAGFGCPYSSVFIPSADNNIAADCSTRNERSVQIIADTLPDAVFVMDSYTPHQTANADEPMSPVEWTESVRVAVDKFRSNTSKVVMMSPPPRGGDLAECFTNFGTPDDCVSRPDKYWSDVRRAEAASAQKQGDVYVDTVDLFCLDNLCPAFAANTPIKSDGTHMSVEYGDVIVPGLREILETAEVL